ncbi:ATP-binding protein [uncultured Rothia sp.]|uniref:ATP-binding protein n=1 Tax=uncultured Rothia sp. TaxID=316088 RepID=UPI00288BF3D0|nr:ATP-binding protein [uncultured Rothia sp.]
MDKYIGIVISVDSAIAEVAMYDMVNDANILWEGQVLPGPKVGSFISILQGNVRIIAKVISEKIIDQQNSIGSKEFDNRYSKDSINRVIKAKSIGTVKGGNFQVTSRYVPMVGNKVSWISQNDYAAMYALGENVPSLRIGEDLLGDQEVNIPIDRIFASHIGVFGNTGSGKSNTLHRLYLNLFRSKYGDGALEKSKFIIIDFNGEYSHDDSFGVSFDDKSVFKLSTRSGSSQRIPLNEDYLFDAEILSMLFEARPATQIPFISSTLNHYSEKKGDWGLYARFIIGTYKTLLTTRPTARSEAYGEWVNLYKEFVEENGPSNNYYNSFFSMIFPLGAENYYYGQTEEGYKNDREGIITAGKDLKKHVNDSLEKALLPGLEYAMKNSPPLNRLGFILRFSYIHSTAWGSVQKEYLDPLMKRVSVALKDLDKVISVENQILQGFKSLVIVDLLNANQNIKRVIPMLFAKMMYGEQKDKKGYGSTSHLVIDEAHNILNANSGELGDHWRDYRLDVFEEIIKEGRKFGFYLTLSSQRPADISPTIVSQIHNYFIHRLVNELDLRMIERTMPTLDRASFDVIPTLGKGECVVTGTAFSLPVFTIVDWDKSDPRPHSDDLLLTDLWMEESNTDSNNQAQEFGLSPDLADLF